MTRIFFFHNVQDRLGAALALVSKAYAQGKDFTLYIPDTAMAQQMDRLLWTHPPLGFLPHCRANSPLAQETRVLITDQLEGLPQNQRLLNLSNALPPGYTAFANVVEVVSQDDTDRQHARQRTRLYKEQGCNISFKDMAAR